MTFISSSCLIIQPRTFSTVVTITGESGHQWFPDLGGKAFTTEYGIYCCFFTSGPYDVVLPLQFIKCFYDEKVLSFAK